MKRLEISRLMDEYTDMEFFPTGGSVANPEAVKGRVLANVRAPAGKKRMPARKKVLLTAALAAVLVVLVGAGFPSVVYRLASGTVGFMEDANSRTISYLNDAPLMELEDGRLFFLLNGGRTDITDLIDEETPYIYDGSDSEAEMTYYIILGGTPEHYGWFEWITIPDPFTPDEHFPSIASEEGLVYTYNGGFRTVKDGVPYAGNICGTDCPDWRMFSDFNPEFEINAADFRWLKAAADQLNIPFIDPTGEPVTIIHG